MLAPADEHAKAERGENEKGEGHERALARRYFRDAIASHVRHRRLPLTSTWLNGWPRLHTVLFAFRRMQFSRWLTSSKWSGFTQRGLRHL